MRMTKRLLSLLLVLLLICLSLPMVLAENNEIIASGYCGDIVHGDGTNLTWTLDDEGTMTICGLGQMRWCQYDNPALGADYRNQVRSVIIENGVTSIGRFAFDNCENLLDDCFFRLTALLLLPGSQYIFNVQWQNRF